MRPLTTASSSADSAGSGSTGTGAGSAAARQDDDAFSRRLDADLLIEASAGTGKTWTLTTLVARLIVEERRRIDELLIVTFTISAAGELRTRVRRTLRAARQAIAAPDARPDDQARRLRQTWRSAGIPEAEAVQRLTEAIRDFDRANITTIHGFCQRTLREFALPAGIPFSFDVSGDDALAVGASVRDFWRRRMIDEPVPLLEYAKERHFVPGDDTTEWVAGHHARQQDIRGADGAARGPEEAARRHEWLNALHRAQEAWSAPGGRDMFLEVTRPERWRKDRHRQMAARARRIVKAFDAGGSAPQKLAPDEIGHFGTANLSKGMLRKNPAPAAPLFDDFELAGELGAEQAHRWLAGRRLRLLLDTRETLHHNAWVDRRLSFDALLVELHLALTGGRGGDLARRIRSRYPIALIDEFQDTDRLQAEIFGRVYPGGAEAANGRLFVVGDPKQSIYRFRGADVFAYLEAQHRLCPTGKPLTLEHNYRSTPELISAVNELFSRPRPFLLPDFPFSPAAAPPGHERQELVVDGDDDEECADPAPFQLVLMPRSAGGASGGGRRRKADVTRLAAEQAAREIARLIALGKEGRAALHGSGDNGDREHLTGGHIAVLVRKTSQGKAVAEALRSRGIDSVELGTDNIFESDEADALYRLLRALCTDESEFNATPLLRGALAADLFGLDMEALSGLRDDDDIWDRWRGLARTWSEVWRDRGIATLMRRVLFAGDPDCSANLLRYPNGPRRLTNYLHLADVLHEVETGNRPSRQGLLDWFRQSRAETRPGDETAQLRLESDDDLVKIVTVHRAKGLEFPIVFCPFVWDGRRPATGRNRKPTAEYYDPDRRTPVLDLDPSPRSRDREHVEEHADELRLLYVALTRARFRCVVSWAPDGQAEYAPMAWLLHGHESMGEDDDAAKALAEHADHVSNLGERAWRGEIRAFAERAGGVVSIREIDPDGDVLPERSDPAAAEPLAARTLGRELALIRQRTSYSALSIGISRSAPTRRRAAVDLPDHDETTVVEDPETSADPSPPEQETETIHTLPSGGRTGNCLHLIFERHLGDPEAAGLERTCQEVLPRFGFQDKWRRAVLLLVENALETPLTRPGETGSVFRLSDLHRPIVEMEFQLPVHAFRRGDLGQCLRAHGYEHEFVDPDTRIDGFLHGYIDLVARHDGRWYVLDYKSNWLGPDLASYSDEAIANAMRGSGYQLQYLLYLTAVHRLLRLRLADYDYDRHVGGALYLFLRGMQPSVPGSGVFRDLPSRACIEALDACFGDTP